MVSLLSPFFELSSSQHWSNPYILQDLHTPQVLAALTSVCTASMLLQPIQGLQKDMAAMTKGKHTRAPHGLLQLNLKRHTGRVRVESELYSLSQGGGIETDAAPQEVITAQLLAAHNVGRLGGLLHLLIGLAKWVETSCHLSTMQVTNLLWAIQWRNVESSHGAYKYDDACDNDSCCQLHMDHVSCCGWRTSTHMLAIIVENSYIIEDNYIVENSYIAAIARCMSFSNMTDLSLICSALLPNWNAL